MSWESSRYNEKKDEENKKELIEEDRLIKI